MRRLLSGSESVAQGAREVGVAVALARVRWNQDRVFSPIIGKDEADVLLIFEEAEALWHAGYLRPGGAALVNQEALQPITVSSDCARHPAEAGVVLVYAPLTGSGASRSDCEFLPPTFCH